MIEGLKQAAEDVMDLCVQMGKTTPTSDDLMERITSTIEVLEEDLEECDE